MLNSEPELRILLLEDLIKSALAALRAETHYVEVKVDIDLDPRCAFVEGDRKDFGYLFYYLIQNSLEAVNPEKPYIKITSRFEETQNRSLVAEIFNTGLPPKDEDMEKIFTPFFSTKNSGSGFGLPIAKLAVRKNHGKLAFIPVPGEGVKVLVVLPAAKQEIR